MQTKNTVLTELKDNILYLSLNRPERKNSLTPELVCELTESLKKLPSGTRAIVIKGREDAFCAGADLEWVKRGIDQERDLNIEESLNLVRMLEAIRSCPVPVISFVVGPAIGAGAGIVMASDFAVISADSLFSFSEVRIGVVPVAIIDLVMQVFPHNVGKDLLLTGKRLSGRELAAVGFSRYIFESQLEGERLLSQILFELKKTKPEAVRLTKRLIGDFVSGERHSPLKIAEMIADLRESSEAKEGIREFFSQRKKRL